MDMAKVEHWVIDIAQAEIMPRFNRVKSQKKADGSLLTEADLAVQARLLERLQTQWPEIPLIGEEMTPQQQRDLFRSSAAFWCLDPLDGTTNFAAGLPYFAVSLALIEAGKVVAGWVYDPLRQECFRAERGNGAWLNDKPLSLTQSPPSTLAECVALVDMKRLPTALGIRLASNAPYRSQRSFGAVALDWCWLAAGRCHIYLHSRQNLWDYAAGSLVLAEAGGVVCISDGATAPCRDGLELGSCYGVGAVNEELFRLWRVWLDNAD